MEVQRIRSLYASLPGRLDRSRRVFGRPLTLTEKKPDGRVERIEARHTMTRERIAWFRAGSALNARPPIDLATGGNASLADATLAPGDTQAKPGKDNR